MTPIRIWLGPWVDIIEEYEFLGQVWVKFRKSARDVTPLDRTKKVRWEPKALAFLASVGVHDEEVRRGYVAAVNLHRQLTDEMAQAKGGRPAQHGNPAYPWVSYRGITLTDLKGNRLSEQGLPISDDTPSYPLGAFPSLDQLRAELKAKHVEKAAQRSHKRQKIDEETMPVKVWEEEALRLRRQVSLNDQQALGLAPQQIQQQPNTNVVRSPSPVSQPALSLSASATPLGQSGSSAPVPSQTALPFPSARQSSVSPSDLPIRPIVSRQVESDGGGDAAVIHIPPTFSSVNRIVPPVRAPSGSAAMAMAMTALPIHYPAIQNAGTSSGQGSGSAEMMWAFFQTQQQSLVSRLAVSEAMLGLRQQQDAQNKEKDATDAVLLRKINLARDAIGLAPAPRLSKDLDGGDPIGEKEYPQRRLPRPSDFIQMNGPLGYPLSSTGLEAGFPSNNPLASTPTPLHISSSMFQTMNPTQMLASHYPTPYGQDLHRPPSFPHFSQFPHLLQTSQSLQGHQHYFNGRA